MSAESRVLIENRYVKAEQASGGVDLGGYSRLQVEVQVNKAGSAGSIVLQHAAVDESDMYQSLGSTVSLASVQADVQTHTTFTRFVRWLCDPAVAGAPNVTILVVAKTR